MMTVEQFGQSKMNSDRGGGEHQDSQNQASVSGAGERRIRAIDNRIDSHELFAGTREITIGHGGDVYRLRITALNKLILTK